MKTLVVFLFYILLSSVVSAQSYSESLLWDQPPLEQDESASDNSLLVERSFAIGVAAPRTFSAPSRSGFNFDTFAADDFVFERYVQVTGLWIDIHVDQLDSYDIDSVFVGVYPDGGGIPLYDPYTPTSPPPLWSRTFDWESNDPGYQYSSEWLHNPVRKNALLLNVTFDLQPGTYWLTMHFIIASSDVSIPPATWLPSKKIDEIGAPARIYVPGNNPSAGASNAFGWYWNTLKRQGVADLSFKIQGQQAPFILQTNAIDNKYYERCSGDEVEVDFDLLFAYNLPISFNATIEVPPGSPLTFLWNVGPVFDKNDNTGSFNVSGMTSGNEYPFTLVFVDEFGQVVLMQDFVIRALNPGFPDPEWIVRDEYGLIGGLFQWRSTLVSGAVEFEIDEEDGNFTDPELSIILPGTTRNYRPTLSDYNPNGNITLFGARSQAYYIARIRLYNPDCFNQTSNWVQLRFQSDECEVLSAAFPGGTYNFQKGIFSESQWVLNEYGTIMDLRVRVRGFHQRWSDVGLAIKTPVIYQGHTVDIPLFAEECNVSWDTSPMFTNDPSLDFFEIYFVIGGNDDTLCPRPPIEGEPTNNTHVEPWGVNVFKQFALGKDKRGTWALEWIDYGIGLPTNGKITDYDVLLCTIPVPPREHIVYKGESKVRRGTVAVYGP